MKLKPRKRLAYMFTLAGGWKIGALFFDGVCGSAPNDLHWMKNKKLDWCLKEAKKQGMTWEVLPRQLKGSIK